MSLQACSQITPVLAAWAAIWFLTAVYQNVSLQSATLGKCLFTLRTNKFVFFIVEISMSLQTACMRKGPIAMLASIDLPLIIM